MAKAVKCLVFVAVSMTVAYQAGAQTPPITFEVPAVQGPGTPGFGVASDPTIQPYVGPGVPVHIGQTIPIDLRGNGRPDVLLCHANYPVSPDPTAKVPCRILRPQPDGTVTDITRQLLGQGALPMVQHPREIVVGDFNHDGRPDMFIAAHGYDALPFDGETNVLLTSNPDGTYADRSSTLPPPDFSHSACVGDVNGDERLDIYVGNISRVAPYMLMGRGDGTFAMTRNGLPPSIANGPEGFLSCLLVDVNGDRSPDLVLGAANPTGSTDSIILFNDGTGDFTKSPRYVLPTHGYGAGNVLVMDIVVLDVNRDGRPDLLLLATQFSYAGTALQLLINRGDGTFADETATRVPASALRTTGPWCAFIRLADFNGDGWEDFYCDDTGNDNYSRLWLNNRNGTWTPVAPDSMPFNSTIGPVPAVDFDGDGRPDLLRLNSGAPDIGYHSWLNRTPRTVPSEPLIGHAIAGDGQTSIFFTAPLGSGTSPITGYTATCSPGTVTGVVTSTGTGSPITVPGLTIGRRYSCSVTATNLAGISLASGTVSVTLPQPMSLDKTSLTFAAVTTGAAFSAQTSPQTVRLTQTAAGPVTWTATSTRPWLVVSPTSGSGSATLTVAVQFAAGLTASQTGSITLTFNGAGNPADAITVTLTAASSTALTFEVPAVQGPGTPGYGVASDPTIQPYLGVGLTLPIDLRGNGRPDVLVCHANYYPGSLDPTVKAPCRILRPQPDGTVTDITRQLLGQGALPMVQHPREIVVADFNRDGRPDVFVADHGYDVSPFSGMTNTVLVSNADGTYTDRSSTLPQVPDFSHSACAGDTNGDGNPDIYVGNWGGVGAPVGPYFLMGRGDGTFTQKITGLPLAITPGPFDGLNNPEVFSTCLLVDLDGDAYPDLVLGTAPKEGHADSIVLFNDGTGDFTRRPRLVLPQGPLPADNFAMMDIVSFDINRDGRPDLMLLSSNRTTASGFGLQVLINRGDRTFADETVTRVPASSRDTGPWCAFILLVDFNGDGWEDLYCDAGNDNYSRVWLNNRNGTWTPVAPDSMPFHSTGNTVHAVDFDGDGRPDLLRLNSQAPDIGYQSWLNRTPRTVPSEPLIGHAIAGNGQASVFFTAPLGSGTSPITGYTATCSPGTVTGVVTRTGTGSPITVAGLTNGRRYSCSVTATNLAGISLASGTVGVTLPQPMSLDKTSLTFAAVTTGGAFSAQTSAQTVRLTQSGAGTVTWTAASTTPWLVVSPTSGSGSATLTISTQFASGLTASQTGTIALAFSGSGNTAGPITVTLTIVSGTAAVSPPFGVFDTPVGDATVLAGSIAVTGWALDNVGVERVEIWRDLQAGETTPPFASTPSDPRNGKVFISNAVFVAGARPDVEALYPTTPFSYRAGWGYLLLTWGLNNQGNGTYTLRAFAFDQESNVTTLGSKTIVVSNNTATAPFGSIDTPAIGGDASGPNFGWALTPKVNGLATCKIPPSGVQVSIDSGPLQPVVYEDNRTDIAGAFTGFSNTNGAGGHYIFDWSTLTNGVHTIGWLITDDCNRADGVGSRFFNVTTGTNLTTGQTNVVSAIAAPILSASALRPNEPESDAPITVARGFGELPEIVTPGQAGSRLVEVKQGERIEIRVPRGFETAYQLVNGGVRRVLPIGAGWDAASGTFAWQPAAGFLGRFRLVFTNGSERISVRVVVTP